MKPVVLGLVSLVMVTAVLPVQARVFSRRPLDGDVSRQLLQLGGQCVYRAPVRINGFPAQLAVTGFEDPQHLRMAEIRDAFQLDAAASGTDALHVIKRSGMVTRLLLLRPAGGDQTVAVTIAQTEAAFRQSRAGAPRGVCPLPLYPGATPGLQAENEDTGLYFATMGAVGEPRQIASFYQASLSAAGWTPVFPDADPRSGLIFLKRDAFCLVLVLPERGTGTARITLLFKPAKDLRP